MWGIVLVILAIGVLVLWLYSRHHSRVGLHYYVFHPQAAAGGGGEKCLWALLSGLGRTGKLAGKMMAVTLFVDGKTRSDVPSLLSEASAHFGVDLKEWDELFELKIVPLKTAWMLTYKYPALTRLLQLISGVAVGLEAALRSKGGVLDPILDLSGSNSATASLSFWTSLGFRRCYAYVHWPFTSLEVVRASLKENPTGLKSHYDAMVAFLYMMTGKVISKPVVFNSTFTETRVSEIWRLSVYDYHKIFPPVDSFASRELMPIEKRKDKVISIGQFRREKDHMKQVDVIREAIFNHVLPSEGMEWAICGSCRPHVADDLAYLKEVYRYAIKECPADRCRVRIQLNGEMKAHADELESVPEEMLFGGKILHEIVFKINLPFAELRKELLNSKVALHTMKDEHFGIVIVDFVGSGCWVVAHRSGGPRYDILRGPSGDEKDLLSGSPPREIGCLAVSTSEFAAGIAKGLMCGDEVQLALRWASKLYASRFFGAQKYAEQLIELWGLLGERKAQ